MRKSRLVAGAAATMLAAGFGIAGAGPASAVDLSVGCGVLNNAALDGVYLTGRLVSPLAFHAGEQLTVTGASGALTLQVPEGTTVDSGTGPTTLRYLFDSDQSTTLLWGAPSSTTWTVSCAYVGVPQDPAPIPPWVQAYGRASKDAACQDGWGQSWQEWATSITGGWVCTRNIPSLG